MAAADDSSGPLWVSVVSSTGRADLAIPPMLPVAELLPDLAAHVGLPSNTVGLRLIDRTGEPLKPDDDLQRQGVESGAVLQLATDTGREEPAPRFDDLVEAAEQVLPRRPPSAAARRRWLPSSLTLLLLVTAMPPLLIVGGLGAGIAAAAAAVALLPGGHLLARWSMPPLLAVAVGWLGCGYAALCAAILSTVVLSAELPGRGASASAEPFLSVTAAGAVVVVAGLIQLVGLHGGPAAATPPVLIGLCLVATGLGCLVAPLSAGCVVTVVGVLAVLAAEVFPTLAVTATAVHAPWTQPVAGMTMKPAEPTDPAEPVDLAGLAADLRGALSVAAAMIATAGVLTVLSLPWMVSLGTAGAALAVMCCVLSLMRVRHLRPGPLVAAALIPAVVGVVVLTVSLGWLRPGWRMGTAAVLLIAGLLGLALTAGAATTSWRAARLLDRLESAVLVSVLPLLALAIDLVGVVHGDR
ncbi:MAG: EsaB/YukD family protein [Nocardioides sp.]|uniref:EsaB/YukD family protein n=1 Tax=Nocardioides sp. TaxID=35761 RepID=UPI0039E21FB7